MKLQSRLGLVLLGFVYAGKPASSPKRITSTSGCSRFQLLSALR